MKKLVSFTILILLFSQLSFALTDNIEIIDKKLSDHKKNLPAGDINQIAYVKKLIDYMYIFDQDLRKLFTHRQNDKQLMLSLKKLDTFHSSKMKEILNKWGWIDISKFGPEYDQKAWLLVQHADEDPFFQAGVLFLLENLVKKGETNKKNYAYLYDRVAAKFHHLGIRQRYGTQVDISNTEFKLQPYEGTLEDVDKRRNEVGLEPLEDYLKMIKKLYLIKGQVSP